MDSKFLLSNNNSVVFVGLACLDIIKILKEYPEEDIGHTCLDCKWQRGGNASNSATVFACLGGTPSFFGTLSDCANVTFLLNDFKKYNIFYDKCPRIANSTCPLSVVILSQSSGSRTVLHSNKNLRELTLEDFRTQLDLRIDDISWFHFEGRDNAHNIFQMINYIKGFNEKCAHPDNDSTEAKYIKIISLEVEKIRLASGMDEYELWQLPDVLFVSKDFAKSQGYQNMTDAAQYYFKKIKEGAVVICAWGENGAAAMSANEGLVTSSAFPPPEVIDSCGAGDTFNASVIRALSTGTNLQDAIIFGCKIAGTKCGLLGYDGIEKTL